MHLYIYVTTCAQTLQSLWYVYRDEEKNNPRTLPTHRPWWLADTSDPITSEFKVAELRAIATQRGIKHDGLKKNELVEKLQYVEKLYSLSGKQYYTHTHMYIAVYIIILYIFKNMLMYNILRIGLPCIFSKLTLPTIHKTYTHVHLYIYTYIHLYRW